MTYPTPRKPSPAARSGPRINDQAPALTSTAGQGVKRGGGRSSKYGNTAVIVDGERVDSKKEAKRWQHLRLLELAGHIHRLERQVVFELAPKAVFRNSRASPAIRYKADFVYIENGEQVVEDVKSAISRKLAAYRMKRHLMMTVHGIEIRET